MNSNFDFLKDTDEKLYDIITVAERLYRGEFFDQCIAQTRRFGEHICRNVLGENRTSEITFDEMLSTLKDKSHGDAQEKEFLDDLYFLKQQGNNSVHSSQIQHDGITALECLQRAFEAAINYSVYIKNSSSDILKLSYDTELLVTGKESKKNLSHKYLEAQEKAISKSPIDTTKTTKTKSKSKPNKKAQVTSMKSQPRKTGISPFWIIVGISMVIACVAMIFLTL